ncbi:MAG TPA: lysophospholipid acyltransferase family protein [Polyangia bacterium]
MPFLRAALTVLFIAVATILGSLAGLVARLVDNSGDLVLDLARGWSRWVTSFAGVKIVVDNRANLAADQPYVFMANHASSLDIWAVFVAIPRRIRLIAKKQLARIPLFGWAMWAGRFIFIDRQNGVAARRSIEVAGKRIHDGVSVLLFPEGTRTRDGTLGPFKKGGFHLAIKAGVPIVPVALRGTRELMPAGSLLLRSGTMTVIIGEPIATQGLSDEERATLSDRVRSAVEAMLRGP